MKTRVLTILTLILALGTISLCFRNYQLKNQLRNIHPKVITKIDTVFLEKPFTTTSYKEVSSPNRVTVYTKGLAKDTIQNQDSVVQFKLNKSSLDLTLYNVSDSMVHTDTYQIDLNQYKYIFSNGVLTQKRVSNLRLSPYLQVKVRPINQFFDLSGGLSLRSGNFTYGLGLGLGYYPKLSGKIHKDLEITVIYNF
jgi:hypothetical protein